MKNNYLTKSADETINLGKKIGKQLKGGEVIELTSDLGGGKTTLTKGLVAGFGSSDPVSSPSFTISNRYQRPDGKAFIHYDFYRLGDPGIMAAELEESSTSDDVVAVEWAGSVENVLPADRIRISIKNTKEDGREITITTPEEQSHIFKELQ